MPTPLYSSHNIDSPAYHLRYGWTGWPSNGSLPSRPSNEFFASLNTQWELDGIRSLELRWAHDCIQITCSVKPTVAPILFISRMKGRLQHSLRLAGTPVSFSRKVSFRSIGENNRKQVEAYITKQVKKDQFIDKRFESMMQKFTVADTRIHLEDPTKTNSGHYWYNLHLVLVTDSRMRLTDERSLGLVAETCDKVAAKKSYLISRRSVMPDHVHIGLRGEIAHSPEEIALSFMNNIAYAFGQKPIFRPSYYAGTFGEYDMGAVRK